MPSRLLWDKCDVQWGDDGADAEHHDFGEERVCYNLDCRRHPGRICIPDRHGQHNDGHSLSELVVREPGRRAPDSIYPAAVQVDGPTNPDIRNGDSHENRRLLRVSHTKQQRDPLFGREQAVHDAGPFKESSVPEDSGHSGLVQGVLK